ncbi:MAG TPA: zinc/iron-chelating domain-containing protein [Solibacterales bacterium]|nr:zinc/iron-chelating domain-containing protein [Bryobacterales bacterium]
MDGLRFTCQPGCTKCCEVKGFVYLTEADLARAAAHLGMTRAAFEERYVYRTRHLLRLRKPRGAQCHFLKEGGCQIHPNKPAQCRLFPFWPELVERRREWQRTGEWCPGIGQGPLIQIGTAVETASEMKRAYPTMYS